MARIYYNNNIQHHKNKINYSTHISRSNYHLNKAFSNKNKDDQYSFNKITNLQSNKSRNNNQGNNMSNQNCIKLNSKALNSKASSNNFSSSNKITGGYSSNRLYSKNPSRIRNYSVSLLYFLQN